MTFMLPRWRATWNSESSKTFFPTNIRIRPRYRSGRRYTRSNSLTLRSRDRPTKPRWTSYAFAYENLATWTNLRTEWTEQSARFYTSQSSTIHFRCYASAEYDICTASMTLNNPYISPSSIRKLTRIWHSALAPSTSVANGTGMLTLPQ